MSTNKNESSMTVICQIKNLKCFDKNRKTVQSFSQTVRYTKQKERLARIFLNKLAKM